MTTKNNKSAKKFVKELTGHVSFGELLLSYRLGLNLTQVQFADMLGISKQDLCNIEKGRKIVGIDRAIDFAKKTGKSPTVFAKYVFEDQLHRAGVEGSIEIKVA
jgi:transcriptional regulator with XRE-family HTH domain